MVGAREADDPGPTRVQQRSPKRDLDRVLAGDAELRRVRQTRAQLRGHRRVGEVAERVDHRLCAPRLEDPRAPVPERGDAEAAGEVEVLVAVGVDDAAPLRSGPDHDEPFRRGLNRPSVSAAT